MYETPVKYHGAHRLIVYEDFRQDRDNVLNLPYAEKSVGYEIIIDLVAFF